MKTDYRVLHLRTDRLLSGSSVVLNGSVSSGISVFGASVGSVSGSSVDSVFGASVLSVTGDSVLSVSGTVVVPGGSGEGLKQL